MRTGIRAGRSAFFPCLIRVPSVARLSPYRRDSPLQFLSTPWLKKVRSGIAGQTRGRPYGDRRVAAGRAAAEGPKLELGNQERTIMLLEQVSYLARQSNESLIPSLSWAAPISFLKRLASWG